MNFIEDVLLSALLALNGALGGLYDIHASTPGSSKWERNSEGYLETQVSMDFTQQGCKGYLTLPSPPHSWQSLKLDGEQLLEWGTPDFSSYQSFFGWMEVNCSQINGHRLDYQASTYADYFARPGYRVRVSPLPFRNFFSGTFPSIAGVVLVLLAIFSPLYKSGYFLSWSIYSILSSHLVGQLGIGIPMIYAHKAADLALWVGFIAYFWTSESIPTMQRRIYLSIGLVMSSLILLARGGDTVQAASMVMFLPSIGLLIQRKWGGALGSSAWVKTLLGVIGAAILNDLAAILGLWSGPILLPISLVLLAILDIGPLVKGLDSNPKKPV